MEENQNPGYEALETLNTPNQAIDKFASQNDLVQLSIQTHDLNALHPWLDVHFAERWTYRHSIYIQPTGFLDAMTFVERADFLRAERERVYSRLTRSGTIHVHLRITELTEDDVVIFRLSSFTLTKYKIVGQERVKYQTKAHTV